MPFTTGVEHQQILDAEGHVLVTGGPGSGKTTTALRKAIKYINEKKLQPGQKILFLSFSRAAITRIQESAEELDFKKYKDLISIQTFHSFFWEILKTHGYLLGSPYRLKVLSPHDEASLLSGRQNDEAGWLAERDILFLSEGKVTFDLFAPKVLEILTKSLAIRNLLALKFPLIIVDEAQDTNSEQWGCIKLFASKTQMIMLADLDQQIHDYQEDINPERIQDIITELTPLEITLGTQNHRSNSTEILLFARHVLAGTPRATPYSGLSTLTYNPRGNARDIRIRQSVGILYDQIRTATGRDAESIAILASYNSGVKTISQALKLTSATQNEIPHKVHFDENATYLSSRLVAFLLEPKKQVEEDGEVITILNIIISFYRANATATNRRKWEQCEGWITAIQAKQSTGRAQMVPEIKRILGIIRTTTFSGTPEKDWLVVQDLLLSSTCTELVSITKNTKYLMAFNSGKMISQGLTNEWQSSGNYKGARNILDASISRSQILSEDKNQKGINVMTIHKAKGKEFDGVILFQNSHVAPFSARGDTAPFRRSKKLLFVGITRAKHHTLIIQDPSERSSLLNGFIF